MKPEEKTSEIKKPYDPPGLKTISLRPEEAVLGHCKMAGGMGPSSSLCGVLCFNLGS